MRCRGTSPCPSVARICEKPLRAAWAASSLLDGAPPTGGGPEGLGCAAVTASGPPQGAPARLGGGVTAEGGGARRDLAREGRPPVDHLPVPGLEHDEVPEALAVILAGPVPVEQVPDGLGPEQAPGPGPAVEQGVAREPVQAPRQPARRRQREPLLAAIQDLRRDQVRERLLEDRLAL